MTEPGPQSVTPFLADVAGLRPVAQGIWSLLPADSPGQPYDRKAAVYDTLIGSSLYNRFVWGADHGSYAAFARDALRAAVGPHLDAGCGSLIGTSAAYVESARSGSGRPWLLVDASLAMLTRARARLGALPPAAALLQADLRTIPLQSRFIDSALCMGMLHLFGPDAAAGLLARIHESLVPRGVLFLTSLVLGRSRGDRFLRFLHRAGEVDVPRTREQVRGLMRSVGFEISDVRQAGNMLYVRASRG
jgi:hypothetical protein